MDAKLKQRLTGAVILTSLAIILLPVLLDGTQEERERVTAQLPEPPRVDLEDITVQDVRQQMAQMDTPETHNALGDSNPVTDAQTRADIVEADTLEEVVVTAGAKDSVPVWQASDALFPDMTYFYPDVDTQGRPVIVDVSQNQGARRVHAYSQDRSDVYAELVLYAEPIDIDARFVDQKKFIEADVRKQSAEVADLIDTFLQGRKAKQTTISFREGNTSFQRRMYFLNTEISGRTVGLRVVIDPRSQTNHEIIEYLEFN